MKRATADFGGGRKGFSLGSSLPTPEGFILCSSSVSNSISNSSFPCQDGNGLRGGEE